MAVTVFSAASEPDLITPLQEEVAELSGRIEPLENKLSGIATGATANETNAQLRDRTTHTGSQAVNTVTGLQGILDAKLETTAAGGVVRGTALTGLSLATATPITATDTVLSGVGKLQAQIAAKLNTTDAPATVRGTALTGLSTATATPVTATDTVLTATGKLQRQATDNAAVLPPPFDTSWYKTGYYYDAVYPYYTTVAPTTGAAGILYFNKRKILNDVTFNALSVNVTTAAAGNSTVFYGVYASDASGLPSTLLASGSASSATTGVKSTAVTLALTKGQVVWDACLFTGASVAVTGFQPIFQDGTESPVANGVVVLIRSSQTSLPADASVGGSFVRSTTPRIPRIALRAA